MTQRSVRNMALAAGFLPCALGFFSACGGDSKSSEDGSDSATASDGSGGSGASDGSNGSGGSHGNTTTTGSTGGPDDLSGTWDVIVSAADGEAVTSTVTLSPTQLGVTGELEVLALITDDIIDIAFEGESIRATREAAGDMDLGVLPLPLAGALWFAGVPDLNNGCHHRLDESELRLECTDDISTPSEFPELENADLTAERTEARNSIFGDLGGRWRVTAQALDCSVLFEANNIDVDCARADSDSGTISITVDNGRITGSTSGGLEFTAQRR